MAQSTDRKILRIGIIQNGKIIEERLLRRRESVTIGQSPRNTFVLPANAVPRSYTLFELKAGVYYLNFRENMDGRVSVEDAVLDFRGLRDQKLAKKRGDHYALTLSEKSRGKVVVGEVTLLFQFVTSPPPPSKLQLPASVRGGWFQRIDWPFANILMGSMVFQVFSIVFVTSREYPEPPKGIEAMPDRFVEFIAKPIPPPEDKSKNDDEDGDKKKDDEGEEKVEKTEPEKQIRKAIAQAKPKAVETPEQAARRKAAEMARMQQNVKNKTILKFITVGDQGQGGGFVDTLKDGASDVKIADAFNGAEGVMVADREGMGRSRRRMEGGATGKVAGIDDDALKAKGPAGPVATGNKGQEIKVRGNVVASKPSETYGTGVLDANAIAGVVKRRMGAVKSCYEKQLKRNPKLAGKVKLQFTIEESGRVGGVKVVQDTTGDPAVGQCISNAIGRWRFPKPDGGSITVAYPFVFTPAS